MIISIIKIIGIILLIALCITLAAILYLLFAPITYRGRMSGRQGIGLRVDVYDLLRLARFSVIYEHGELNKEFAFLWGLISGNLSADDEADDTGAASDTDTTADTGIMSDTDAASDTGITSDTDAASDTGPATDTDISSDIGIMSDSGAAAGTGEDADTPEKPDNTDQEHKAEIIDPAWDTDDIESDRPFEEPDQNIREPIPPEPVGSGSIPPKEPGRIEWIRNIISSSANQRAMRLIFDGALSLLYRARPHFKGADIEFSTGSPDITGQFTGAMSLCAGVYSDNVRLIPDFNDDNPYIRGWADIYGRLSLIFAVAFMIRVIASRDCRRLYRQIRSK